MCTEDIGKRSQTAWNNWLNERDLAPNEMLAQWVTEQAEGGLSAALDLARSGLGKVSSFQHATGYARAGLENVPSLWHATANARSGLEKMVSFQGCGESTRSASTRHRRAVRPAAEANIQELLHELFQLHDLKSNGVLEEDELIKINEKVALLHYGKEGTDKAAIREKYRSIFREHLDAQGLPVPFEVFRDYMQGVVSALDSSPDAQEMMLEQFVAEAQSGREAFRYPSLQSESDFAFMPEGEECMRGLHGEADNAETSQSSLSMSSLTEDEQLQSPDSSPTRISAGLGLQSSMPKEVASPRQLRPLGMLDVPFAPALQHVSLPREFSHGVQRLQSDGIFAPALQHASPVSDFRHGAQRQRFLPNPTAELHIEQTTVGGADVWLQASPHAFAVSSTQAPSFSVPRVPVEQLQPQWHRKASYQQYMLQQPFKLQPLQRVVQQPAVRRSVSVGVHRPTRSPTQPPWQQQQQLSFHYGVQCASDPWKSQCARTAHPVAFLPQNQLQARQVSFIY